MKRQNFIKLLGLTTLSIPMMSSLHKLNNLSDTFSKTSRMPLLFLGHGSPMNGIEDNAFVRGFKKQRETMQKPNAIIVVSAHWETKGTFVTAMDNPKTIHDFGGFPEALYQVQYPAPGSPELAKEIADIVEPKNTVGLDDQWGLDHGSWTVVKHLFPEADVPVIQLSLDYTKPPEYHYKLAQQLKKLRDKGVLIIGSGNIVHNLRRVAYDKVNENFGYDWAIEANEIMKTRILQNDHQNLIDYNSQGLAFNLAIPTPEHYLPLLYILGLKGKEEEVMLFNDNTIGGSISMTSVKIG